MAQPQNAGGVADDAHDTLLDDLLARWELARLEGVELSAEQIALDHPDMLATVSEGIATLQSMAWVFEGPPDEGLAEATLSPLTKPTKLPASRLTQAEFLDGLSETLSGLSDSCDTIVDRTRVGLKEGTTLEQLALQLVEEGVLTAYQASVLLTRGAGPLLLDRYIVLDLIGVGGMGRVYKAVHRSMKRVVALKVLPADAVDSPAMAERFRREIKAAACLNHPNIVTALDAHEAGGDHFLVMEYVPGKNLFELVRHAGPMAASQATTIIAQIAAALGEAHQQGIIHRDVKPSNIILSEDGPAKLLDLGIALFKKRTEKKQTEIDENHAPLTEEGIPVGTVAYIAPEQARNSKEADARSDIYSLGCTLYFLITGKLVFDKRSGVQVVAAHVAEKPPRLGDTISDVPAKLEKVFRRMVAKSPNERYASMAEVVMALQKTGLVDEDIQFSISSQPVSLVRRSTKIQRLAWLVALLMGVVLMGTVWLGSDDPLNSGMSNTKSPAAPSVYHSEQELRVIRLLYERGAVLHYEPQGDYVKLPSLADLPKDNFVFRVADLTNAQMLEDSILLLKELPQLKELWMRNVVITDSILDSILSLDHIIVLELSGTDLDDERLMRFAEMKQLVELNVGNTKVTKEGMQSLLSRSSKQMDIIWHHR